ncbi:MAG: DDE-type integrase/transposase/recombinase [Candidatus Hodarchaeales archaeon]
MTHTSLFFREVTQAVFMLACNEVTNTRSSVIEVAKRFDMAPTTLHEFVTRVRVILVTKVGLVKRILLREKSHLLTLTGLNKAIYMVEVFLKIKGSTYYLIVAINSEGTPLCWKLASSRKSDVIEGVMRDVFEYHGIPRVIITDGNPTYKKILTNLQYEGIHVVRIHKGIEIGLSSEDVYSKMVLPIILKNSLVSIMMSLSLKERNLCGSFIPKEDI